MSNHTENLYYFKNMVHKSVDLQCCCVIIRRFSPSPSSLRAISEYSCSLQRIWWEYKLKRRRFTKLIPDYWRTSNKSRLWLYSNNSFNVWPWANYSTISSIWQHKFTRIVWIGKYKLIDKNVRIYNIRTIKMWSNFIHISESNK